MIMTAAALRVAIIGMGGFAQAHHRALQRLEAEGECRVVCTCDPNPDAFPAQTEAWDLAGRGVRVYSDYREMLDAHAGELDLATVPTPVPLHAPMHRACVERGLGCYLEKPPTLYHAELDEMLAVEAGAAQATQVGFLFIVENTRQELKARLLRGEFGALRRVGFVGNWPRKTTYFTRSAWAGRLLMDGRPVLDSCIGNAMAHFLHNLHFWCGQDGLFSWKEAAEVEAELYRAHAIENFDTCFVRAQTAGGVELRVAATHACIGTTSHREWVECDAATITYVTGDTYQIEWKNGRTESESADRRDLLTENFRAYFRYLRGESGRPLTRLIDAQPFVHCCDLMLLASGGITPVSEPNVERQPSADGDGEYVAIEGIRNACDTFATTGVFPSRQGAPWARPGGTAVMGDLPELLAVVQRMGQA
jgi:predicted dehydrogenase